MKKKIIIIAVCAAAAAIGAFCGYKILSASTPENLISPQIGSIEKIISEDGVVTSEDTYNITSKVSGQITECRISAGDKVTGGQVLYELDSKSVNDEIEQTEISLKKSEAKYAQSLAALEDLSVKSNASGTVSEIYVHDGDYVTAGTKLADITNTSALILKIPFQSADISKLYIGEDCSVILANGSKISGAISKIYKTASGFSGGKSGVYTEITVKNPGSLKAGDSASAIAGDAACLAEGTFENETEQTILCAESGYIDNIYVNEGDAVSNGVLIAAIRNDTLSSAVTTAALESRELEIKLGQLKESLEDYKITAPHDGVVKTLNRKANDYASPEEALAVIAVTENSYVETDIDEMYINQIKVGQKVRVTPQGESESAYLGTVYEIKTEGKTENGVTYYTVKTKLDESGDLMDAMNVRTEIITESKDNVLMLPRDAVLDGSVRLYENGKSVQTEVSTGISNDEYVEITAGLTQSSQIVSD